MNPIPMVIMNINPNGTVKMYKKGLELHNVKPAEDLKEIPLGGLGFVDIIGGENYLVHAIDVPQTTAWLAVNGGL